MKANQYGNSSLNITHNRIKNRKTSKVSDKSQPGVVSQKHCFSNNQERIGRTEADDDLIATMSVDSTKNYFTDKNKTWR